MLTAPPRAGQVVGSAERVAETLAEFVAHGFTTLLFWLTGDAQEQLERLARDVIPRVHHQVPSR